MKKADEYRLRAAECLALALRMPSAEERDQLRNMANIWEDLAASVETSSIDDDAFPSWEAPASQPGLPIPR